MPLNPAVIMPPLMQQLWDKTLNVPLAGGFVNFYHDNARTTPKDVYELVGTGPGSYSYVSLGSVLQLSGIGTYIDSSGGNIPIYLWPFAGSPNDQPPSTTADNYYVTVYSLTGVFQFDIPNWPGVPAGGGSGGATSTSDNIISNGQFVDIDFPATATSSTPQSFTIASGTVTTEIAPNWSVTTTGAGTVNVWQNQIAGATTNIGNPAYSLGISTTGFSLPIQLTQTIQAPRILASTPVSATFIAQSNGANVTLSMTYTPSITSAPQTLASGTAISADYTVIANATPISITNPGVGTGSVNVSIVIPAGTSVNISCVQLCAAINNAIVGYIQETPEREEDHLFHYFHSGLAFKPIPSYLVGWDFPLNPAQFFGDSVGAQAVGANKSYYVWDQTIIFQTANSGVTTARLTKDASLQLTAAVNGQLAVIQYLEGNQARNMFVQCAKNGISAYAGIGSLPIRSFTISLWYSANPSFPVIATGTNNSIVTALDANGHPTVVAGWTEIKRASISESNQFSNVSASIIEDFFFSYFRDSAPEAALASKFAIVIGTSALTAGDILFFQSVSVVPGLVATPPGIQKKDEVLRECQYYYETSDPDSFGAFYSQESVVAGGNAKSYVTLFELQYQQTKRIAPNVTLTDLSSNANAVTGFLYFDSGAGISNHPTANLSIGAGITFWTNPVVGTIRAEFVPNTVNAWDTQASASNYSSASIAFNYVLDARLGIV